MVRALRRMLATVGTVALLPIGLAAQEPATIAGQVVSQDGKPIPGATIAIPEMGLGATSRTDGRYTMTVPAARVQGQRVSVTARAINFKPQTVQVTIAPGQQSQDFSLAANPLQLGEIVVTGTGTTTEVEKNPNVRNSVSAEAIQKSNESNVIQALAAQAPGVQVSQQSGEPGAGSFINIRGIRTVYGDAQPLLVIDGTPVNNDTYSTGQFNPTDELATPEVAGVVNMNRAADINPNDIESVEILKGAAASALYGSRAASGVILIKTKSGRAGPTHFSIGTTYSSDRVAHYYDLQTRWGQGTAGVDPRVANPAACDAPSGACRRSWGPDLTDPATAALGVPTTIYDHAKEAYTDGYASTTVATVSGGNDRTTFFVSGEYLYNRGVFVGPNNKFQRGTVRVNASQRIGEAFKVGANVSYANTFGQFVQRGNNVNGLQLGLLRTPPNFNNVPYLDPVTGTHRSYLFQNPSPTDIAVNRGFDNPLYTLNEGQNTSQVNRVFGNVNLDYQATKFLKFAYTIGGDYNQDERMNAAGQQSSDVSVGGRVVEGKITNLSLDQNLNGTANWRRDANLAGTVTLGTTLNIRNYRDLGNTGRTLITQPPFRLSNTVTRDPVVDNQSNIHNLSFFGQATVDLWSQFYITAAATRFGSSTFTSQNTYRWYPKIGASWEFTKALKLGEGSFLSYGKLRAAYGEAGTEAPAYVANTTYNALPFFGAVQGTSLTPTIGGNPGLASNATRGSTDLGPEISKETEVGTDIGFWKDRADISFTYYHSLTSDVILPLPIAPSSGFLFQWQNAMELRNAGAEISLNVRPVVTRDVSWDVGLQWSKNKSRVLSIANNVSYVGTDPAGATAEFVQWVAIPGEEYGVLRSQGYIRCGISPAGTLGSNAGGDVLGQACAGAPKGALYIDDGTFGTPGLPVDDPTLRVMANPNPNWLGSARTSVRWKKLTVSGLIDVKNGGQVWNGTKGALLSYGTAKETETRCVVTGGVCVGNEHVIGTDALYGLPAQPVVGPGAGTPVAIGQAYYTGLAACPFSGIDDGCIENGGYVKFRELSLGWTVDYPWVQKSLGLSSIDVRVAGRNLHTWSSYSGYDPEANLGGNISARSADYFNSPQTRSFVFSVTLNR